MITTFGLLGLFVLFTLCVLQLSLRKGGNYSEFAVGGRSFGGAYQAMSFLNTWYPGTVFVAFAGLTAASGVVGFYLLSYSLLTIVFMYLMAQRVWTWGASFDLRTQADLLALRYDSSEIRVIVAVVGVLTSFPWLVLGIQALGLLFQYLSLHRLTFEEAVVVGVLVMALRQIWTIRMGMRGVVISDMIQGVAAYIGGTLLIIGLIAWLMVSKNATFSALDPRLFAIPGIGSYEGPLYLFSLIFTGAIGGWCWPSIFVRLFTADGVKSMKKAAAIAVPISLVFCVALLVLALLATVLPEVRARPNDVWFIVNSAAGGEFLLGLAGIAVFAATVGSVDGLIQASGTLIGNDLVAFFVKLSQRKLVAVTKIAMIAYTILAAWVASWNVTSLFALAVLAYQGVVQLAVPQFLGIFWDRGNRLGALLGTSIGFVCAVVLEFYNPVAIPSLGGLTSGVAALVINAAVYVACAYLAPQTPSERERVRALFDGVEPEARPLQLDVQPAAELGVAQ